MQKTTLSGILEGKLFRVPDYQRGYAWEEKQWQDLIDDVEALVTDDRVKTHYAGTIVTFYPAKTDEVTYDQKNASLVDVVDGQQRLTTICLYLATIIRALQEHGQGDFCRRIPEFLYEGTTCKVTPHADTRELYYQLLINGKPRIPSATTHGKRLCRAAAYFTDYVTTKLNHQDFGPDYLARAFRAITGKLAFTHYRIEEECEIGMTFELMNSRGKGLSVLELLKNYLMHWISRNGDEGERKRLTDTVNSAWSNTYTNVGTCGGDESQCLRVAWTLYCHHLPKNWKGYEGFKDGAYIPLRNFTEGRPREKVRDFLVHFSNGLADVSKHYATITAPTESNTISTDESEWLSKIRNTGNTANFLPLIVAARASVEKGTMDADTYIELLKALEKYAYRVYLYEGKRSNAGRTSFFRWGKEIFKGESDGTAVISWILGLIQHYAPNQSFESGLVEPSEWYSWRRLVKYTLFEYEKKLVREKGKGASLRITWKDLASDSTIEHILPQNPKIDSKWVQIWSEEDQKQYTHDIGNLVLTRNNSNYLNFEFERKCGKPGVSPSYADSGITQEREVASFKEWNPESLLERRAQITDWIRERWGTPVVTTPEIVGNEEDDDDAE